MEDGLAAAIDDYNSSLEELRSDTKTPIKIAKLQRPRLEPVTFQE
jgi:hypothetical protein